MTLSDLKLLVKQGEGLFLEFKLRIPEPEKMAREAIALSNTAGGYLLFGVDDDGTISGLNDPDEVVHSFETTMKNLCLPLLNYSIEIVPVSRKKSVVAIQIPESICKPHYLKGISETNRGPAFYRVADRSIRASKELFQILKYSGVEKGTKFEFGDKEKQLIEYLETHEFISLDSFARLAGIKKYNAGRTLVLLTMANILHIHPDEGEDLYSLSTSVKENQNR